MEKCPICEINLNSSDELQTHGLKQHNVDFLYTLADHLGVDITN